MLTILLLLSLLSSQALNIYWGNVNLTSTSNLPELSCEMATTLVENKIYMYGGVINTVLQSPYPLTVNTTFRNTMTLTVNTDTLDAYYSSLDSIVVPEQRSSSASTYNDITNEIVIFGGYTLRNNMTNATDFEADYIIRNTVYFNDLWAFNVYSKQWRQLMSIQQANALTNVPRARVGANFVTVKYKNCLYGLLDGGYGTTASGKPYSTDDVGLGDMWLLNFTSMGDNANKVNWYNAYPIPSTSNIDLGSGYTLYTVVGSPLIVDSTSTYAYRFGGYSCFKAGTINLASSECYINNFYRLNINDIALGSSSPNYFAWEVINATSGTVPSYRVYHNSAIYNSIFYVIGGSYKNTGVLASSFYYNDIYAFDIATFAWLTISVVGSMDTPATKFSLVASHGILWLFGGWAGNSYFKNMQKVYLDIKIYASNLYASGDGITTAYAGKVSTFKISVRESTQISTNNTQSAYSWGSVLPYGVGVSFSFTLVGYSNRDSSVSYLQYSKIDTSNYVDNLDGTYTLSYTTGSGTSYSLSITYIVDGQSYEIPGSPFTVLNNPSLPAASYSIVFGPGATQAVPLTNSNFYVLIRDQYSNPIQATLNSSITSQFVIKLISGSSSQLISPNSIKVVDSSDFESYSADLTLILSSKGIIPNVYRFDYTLPANLASNILLNVTYASSALFNTPSVVVYESAEVSSSLERSTLGFFIFCVIITCIVAIALLILQSNQFILAASPNYLLSIMIGSFMVLIGCYFKIYIESLSESYCATSSFFIDIGFVFLTLAVFVKSYYISILDLRAYVFIIISNIRLYFPIVVTAIAVFIFELIWIFVDPQKVVILTVPNQTFLTYHACGSNSSTYVTISYSYKALLILFGLQSSLTSLTSNVMFNEGPLLACATFGITIVCGGSIALSFFLTDPSVLYALEIYSFLIVVLTVIIFAILPKFFYAIRNDSFDFDASSVTDLHEAYIGSMINETIRSISSSTVSRGELELPHIKAHKDAINDEINATKMNLTFLDTFIRSQAASLGKLRIEKVKLKEELKEYAPLDPNDNRRSSIQPLQIEPEDARRPSKHSLKNALSMVADEPVPKVMPTSNDFEMNIEEIVPFSD